MLDHGKKTYPPSDDFISNAKIDRATYEEMYARSIEDPDGFWTDQLDRLDWITRPTKIRSFSP